MPTQGHAARSYTLPALNVTGHVSGPTLTRYNRASCRAVGMTRTVGLSGYCRTYRAPGL